MVKSIRGNSFFISLNGNMRLIFWYSLLLWVVAINASWAEEQSPIYVTLNGFLGKEEITKAKNRLEEVQQRAHPRLILEINSNSGDLGQVLDFAKTIYELKVLHQLPVVVYIHDNAIGPAAILPFLADELDTALFISWGDIPLGSEGTLPTNILRNRVRSLIDPRHPHADVLAILADGMTDPNVQIVEDQGWKIIRDQPDNRHALISPAGQTLVVNQIQLQNLQLVNQILPLAQFKEHYQTPSPMPSEGIATQNQEELPFSLQTSPQALQDKFRKFIRFNPDGLNRIGYLYVGDRESMISEATWLYIRKALDYYQQQRPVLIVLELNTPGGEVFAAQKISDALKEMDTQYGVPVVAFINNWAISAGAMLTYSCRFITAVKDASMGAAAPVYAGEGGQMHEASEKVNSALRSDFASRARFFDRNPLIAEAMVDKDLFIVLRHGRIVKLDSESQLRTTGPYPDIVISPKGKLLTLNADELLEYGVADLVLPPEKLVTVTEEEKKSGHWPADRMLLFHVAPFSEIPQATIDAYQMDWKTSFFVFLATPIISSLLFMGLIVGGYLEINHPGFGLPGMVAGVCLFLIILSSFSLEAAKWLELILLLTGIILILVELFVLPTVGILAVLGIILTLMGLFGLMLPNIRSVHFDYDTNTLNAAGQYFMQRLAWLSATFIFSTAIIAVLARYVAPSFTGFNRFILAGHEQEAARGFVAGENPDLLPQPQTIGEALTPLKPSGKILVNDKVYEAVSTGDWIDAGAEVVVVRLEGNVIRVNRRID